MSLISEKKVSLVPKFIVYLLITALLGGVGLIALAGAFGYSFFGVSAELIREFSALILGLASSLCFIGVVIEILIPKFKMYKELKWKKYLGRFI